MEFNHRSRMLVSTRRPEAAGSMGTVSGPSLPQRSIWEIYEQASVRLFVCQVSNISNTHKRSRRSYSDVTYNLNFIFTAVSLREHK